MVCRWAANSIISMRGRWRRRSGRGDRWVDGGRSSSYLAPMALLPLIETPDPRLRVISKPVETFDAELTTLVTDLIDTLYDAIGFGLAGRRAGGRRTRLSR